jgi:adenylate cyclase
MPAIGDRSRARSLPPDDVYFADGIAEDIIIELSHFSDLFVIDRNSSFTYRSKSVRVTDAARELGVQYVLEGSVRRADRQVRSTAQSIDARAGNSLWAQHYDRSLANVSRCRTRSLLD